MDTRKKGSFDFLIKWSQIIAILLICLGSKKTADQYRLEIYFVVSSTGSGSDRYSFILSFFMIDSL